MASRLLSPNKQRIYPNAMTGARFNQPDSGPTSRQRAGLEVGQMDQFTWDALVKMGWTEYDGPAVTDERGYIVAGSDPDIKP